MPNQNITAAQASLRGIAIAQSDVTAKMLRAQDDWDALQAVVLRTGQDFCSGNLGLMYPNLHMLSATSVEGLYDWSGSFDVGGGATKMGKWGWVPGTAVTPAEFTIEPGGSYANAYNFVVLPTPPKLPSRFVDLRIFSMTPEQQKNCQALEFESQITLARQTHNMAWQFDFAENLVRYFNYNKRDWEQVPNKTMPIPAFSQEPILLTAEFVLTPTTTEHVSLGVVYTKTGYTFKYLAGVTQPSTPTKDADKFTSAIQVDGNQAGDPTGVSIHYHEVRFAY